MKRILLTLALLSGLNSFGQMVSEKFEEDLARRHPKSSAVNWIPGEEFYVAEFQEGDRKMKASYTQDGEWVSTRMEVSVSEIPEKILAQISEEYKVIGADKVVSSQSPQGNYLIRLEVGYTKSGALVK